MLSDGVGPGQKGNAQPNLSNSTKPQEKDQKASVDEEKAVPTPTPNDDEQQPPPRR